MCQVFQYPEMNPTKPHDLFSCSSKSHTHSGVFIIPPTVTVFQQNSRLPITVEGKGEEDIKCLCFVYTAVFEVTNLVMPWPNAVSNSFFAMNIFVNVPFIVLPCLNPKQALAALIFFLPWGQNLLPCPPASHTLSFPP